MSNITTVNYLGYVLDPPGPNITKNFCDIALFARVVEPEYLEHPATNPCDPLAHCIIAQRCHEMNQTIHGLFRTLSGECNNLQDPRLGMALSKLLRLLPAKYDKFSTTTYFQKPSQQGIAKLLVKMLLRSAVLQTCIVADSITH